MAGVIPVDDLGGLCGWTVPVGDAGARWWWIRRVLAVDGPDGRRRRMTYPQAKVLNRAMERSLTHTMRGGVEAESRAGPQRQRKPYPTAKPKAHTHENLSSVWS